MQKKRGGEVAKDLTKDFDLDKWLDDYTRYLFTASQLLIHPLFFTDNGDGPSRHFPLAAGTVLSQ